MRTRVWGTASQISDSWGGGGGQETTLNQIVIQQQQQKKQRQYIDSKLHQPAYLTQKIYYTSLWLQALLS